MNQDIAFDQEEINTSPGKPKIMSMQDRKHKKIRDKLNKSVDIASLRQKRIDREQEKYEENNTYK